MVYITGIGVVPPGLPVHDLDTLWRRILSGPSLIGNITRFTSEPGLARFSGEVEDASVRSRLDARTARTSSHPVQLALLAGKDAIADSALPTTELDPWTLGVFAGTALGGWTEAEKQFVTFLEKGARRVNPFLVNSAGRQAAATELAKELGAHGPNSTVSSGCTSSLQAIGDATLSVKTGQLTACLAGGMETPLSPLVTAMLVRTEELSTSENPPSTVSRPFDRGHSGFVLSEGACFLALENNDLAKARGARRYAEILGSASSCDAGGAYQIDESGESGARAIISLLQRAGISPSDIDYICAHANSSPAFDRKEAVVLKKAFGEFAASIPVSSIKGVLGHPFGASGAFQTAAAAMAMKHSLIPPTCNLEDPDPDCDLDLVMGEPRKKTIRHALITSYGYGGVNSYLLLRNPNL